MAVKQWYLVEIECIKYNPTCDLLVGEKSVIAKVKSYGLAYNVAQFLTSVYNPEYFKINIK